MFNEPTEPSFDERDVEDDVMNDLPEGDERMPLSQESNDSYNALSSFFANARDF